MKGIYVVWGRDYYETRVFTRKKAASPYKVKWYKKISNLQFAPNGMLWFEGRRFIMFTIHTSKLDTIILDNKEFFFLAGIIGSDHLLGVENPYEGYVAEELAEEWKKTQVSLLEKGYLLRDENEVKFSIPPIVFSRVAIACLAERTCWFKYSDGGNAKEVYLHVTNERVVQVRIAHEHHETCYKLDDIGSIEEACHKIIDKFHMLHDLHTDMPALMFSQQQFNEIYEQSQNSDVDILRQKLAEASDDIEGCNLLANCLRYRSAEGEFHLSIWTGEEWETQQLAFLMNGSVNWLIRQSAKTDQDWLIASPINKKEFQDTLLMWLQQSSQSDVR